MKTLYLGIDCSLNSTAITYKFNDCVNYIYLYRKLNKKQIKIIKQCHCVTSKEVVADDTYQNINIQTNFINYSIKNLKKNFKINSIICGIEGLPYGAIGRVADLAGLHFSIISRLIHLGMQENIDFNYKIIPPSTLKKYSTGTGNASKNKMIEEFLKKEDRLNEIRKIDDFADSFFLMKYVKNEKN